MDEFHIQWHVTSRCNLRCIHCYQDTFTEEGELSFEELKKIADNLITAMRRWNRYLTISLTGGEPLLKKDVWELLDYLSSFEEVTKISFITNGTIIDRHITTMDKYPVLKEIYVSLDGTNAETNDSIRGKGTFNKAIKNIDFLKRKGYRVFLMYTLSNKNIKDADKLIEFSKQLSLDGAIVERFIPIGRGIGIKEDLIGKDQLDFLYKTIFEDCGIDYNREEAVKYHALKVEFDKNNGFSPYLYGAECIVGKDGCAILPDGTILPCRRFPYSIGNLLVNDLTSVWRESDVLNNLRSKENLGYRCRSCRINDCSGCRAMAYNINGDYLSYDPLCRLNA